MSIENMIQRLELAQPVIAKRDQLYRGQQTMTFTQDELVKDFKHFNVNLCRLAITAVAERMRISGMKVMVGTQDVSEDMWATWDWSGMDQKLQSALIDAMAVGSAYLLVWVDGSGRASMTVESAEHVITEHDPITGETTRAIKRWFEHDHVGAQTNEHVVLYERDQVTRFVRGANNTFEAVDEVDNPLGVVPVIPLINRDRISDTHGYSVNDDLGPLVNALSKIIADMLTASETVARPRRWATGIALEEGPSEGFSADDPGYEFPDDEPYTPVHSPFSDTDMWATEESEARFGQLPGADLGGYETAVNVILQQIMAVSALPAHMVGVTTANPSSADAIRAAEASLTARAEGRARAFSIEIENAIKLLAAITYDADFNDIGAWVKWHSFATRSRAQDADAATKLFSLGVITEDEAREIVGIGK